MKFFLRILLLGGILEMGLLSFVEKFFLLDGFVHETDVIRLVLFIYCDLYGVCFFPSIFLRVIVLLKLVFIIETF